MTPSRTEFTPPYCVFVTGPAGPARARWLEEQVARVVHRAASPARPRCGILLLDEGLTRTKRFADAEPAIPVRCLFMPCLCCPGMADLPRVARRFAEENQIEVLFIEVPPLAAAGLIGEFDHVLRWRREVVVCLNRDWDRARRSNTLSSFQTRLLLLADQVVAQPEAAIVPPAGAPVPTLSFTEASHP
jgi:hypothetical protein